MAVNGTGSLVVLVVVLFGVITFQAQVEGKSQGNFNRDKEDNVSRIVDYSDEDSLIPKEANIEDFPWQVLMQKIKINSDSLVFSCGGSIIGKQWIMSAAHCVTDRIKDTGYTINVKRIVLVAGTTKKVNFGNNAQIRDFSKADIDAVGTDKRVFVHEDYNRGIIRMNDIVLFKLKNPLRFNEFIKPIILATPKDVEGFDQNTEIKTSGWGLTGFTDKKKCQFPFIYKDKTYKDCTTVGSLENGHPWCSTNRDKNSMKHIDNRIFCDANLKPNKCVFPFTYKGKKYNECTTEGSLEPNRQWCSTKRIRKENNKHIDNRKFCYDTTGCNFPFKLNGVKYEECTTYKSAKPGRPWCKIGKGKRRKFCDGNFRELADNLRYVTGLKLESEEDCAERYKYFTVICTYTPKKSTNKGDSGGPLVAQVPNSNPPIYIQIGITSAGLPSFHGSWANIAKLRPWIDATMEDEFFRSIGRRYKLIKDMQVSWENAKRICHSKGMRLAEPRDDIVRILRKDTLNEFGNLPLGTWVGASAHDDKFVFEVSRAEVPKKSPLVHPKVEKIHDMCLKLNLKQEDWVTNSNSPYQAEYCSGFGFPLCEDFPEEFFVSSGRLYRLLLDAKFNWEAAKSKCNSVGMKLAAPRDNEDVGLRKDLLKKYGDNSRAWLGAKGNTDDNEFKIVLSKDIISPENTLFYNTPIVKDNCLVLDVGEMGIILNEETPYDAYDCSKSAFYPLCEDYPSEYFRSSGHWYRLFKDESVTWEAARSKCRSYGMRLAEPCDATAAKALRKDSREKYDVFNEAWIGAQVDGEQFVFKVGGNTVPIGSPLLHEQSGVTTNKVCLTLNGNEKMDDPPYNYKDMSALLYPLCEDSPDTSSDIVCSEHMRAIITRSGSLRCVLPTNVTTTTEVVPTRSCPDDEDFFTQKETDQCFKIIPQKATWRKADEECKKLNLTLAHPTAPVQLRSYLVKTYEPEPFVWLGACQDEPNKITWKRSGEEITLADPLWYPGQPDHDEGCLLLLARDDYLEEEPEKPFWNVLSKYEFYPLCEMVLE